MHGFCRFGYGQTNRVSKTNRRRHGRHQIHTADSHHKIQMAIPNYHSRSSSGLFSVAIRLSGTNLRNPPIREQQPRIIFCSKLSQQYKYQSSFRSESIFEYRPSREKQAEKARFIPILFKPGENSAGPIHLHYLGGSQSISS